jgi:hypothetical protein|eukprot:TRINITY_DN5638_c0_g1_i1.p1 TRINITY_DN5638_c0_g1~~TRINITY_DN5638_c0_g1_i1.p1  ORF type:complete len:293 (-),score=97.36 TRINITY_DN5638_c0_g1_i1:129-935(-)
MAEGVKGMAEAMRQADEGMKLFGTSQEAEGDVPAATAFKEEIDAKIAALDEEVAALTGKENKKARTEKEKEKAALKNQKDYIDACKVVKGLAPVHGHFVKSAAVAAAPATESAAVEAAPAAAAETEKKEKKEKPKKAQESAGISKAERDELEGLKTQIIEKKAALKEQGLSGGQINKNEEIVALVARMNELKEKENPGSTQAAGKDDKKGDKKKKKLDSQSAALLETKQKALDEYVEKLKTEFKYSKKEIAGDPEYVEMKAEIDKLSK